MKAPIYWMNETTGILKPAMEHYLYNVPLAVKDIGAIRAYLRQWVRSEVWDQNPYSDENGRALLANLRELVDSIHDRAGIDTWLDLALELGMDPL